MGSITANIVATAKTSRSNAACSIAIEKAPLTDARACQFLDLAPELRNHIYELVLPLYRRRLINPLEVRPPPKALLLVCRQIHHETKQYYKESRTSYYKNSFTIKDIENQNLDDLGSVDLHNAIQFSIRGRNHWIYTAPNRCWFQWVAECKAWEVIVHWAPDLSMYAYVAVQPDGSQAVLRFVDKRPSNKKDIKSLMERPGATIPIMDQLNLIRSWMRWPDEYYDTQEELARKFRESVGE